MVVHHKFQLLDQIAAEQVRPGDGCHIGARLGDMPEGQPVVGLGKACRAQPNLWIIGANSTADVLPAQRFLEFGAQEGGRCVIQFL